MSPSTGGSGAMPPGVVFLAQGTSDVVLIFTLFPDVWRRQKQKQMGTHRQHIPYPASGPGREGSFTFVPFAALSVPCSVFPLKNYTQLQTSVPQICISCTTSVSELAFGETSSSLEKLIFSGEKKDDDRSIQMEDSNADPSQYEGTAKKYKSRSMFCKSISGRLAPKRGRSLLWVPKTVA